MNGIYTRNYGKTNRTGGRISPPPGYVGNAFSTSAVPDVKLHEAEDDLTALRRKTEPLPESPETASAECAVRADVPEEPETSGPASAASLLRYLRGKIGSEELILILVMLLVASEESGAELLVLTILLLAG